MISINVIGRVGKDAATKTVGQGRLATSWSVAVNVGWGDNKETLWFDCTMWGERGEKVGAHIAKGDQIGVTGSLSTREHEGKTYLKIDVQDVTLIGGKRDDKPARSEGRSSGGRASNPQYQNPTTPDNFEDSDIPF